jgi:hypothetical protein
MIGVSCFLVLAGFIEGFLTRFTDIPNLVRGTLIFLSLALVIGYFVIYPRRRAKQGLVRSGLNHENLSDSNHELQTNAIKSNGELVFESWKVFISTINRHLIWGILVAAGYTGLLYYFLAEDFLGLFDYGMFDWQFLFAQMFDALWFWDEANNFFEYPYHWSLFPLSVAATTVVLFIALRSAQRKVPGIPRSSVILNQFNALIAALLLCSTFWMFHVSEDEFGNFFLDIAAGIFCFFWWPYILIALAISQCEKTTLFVAMGKSIAYWKKALAQGIKLFVSLGLVAWVGLAVIGAPLFYLIFEILGTQFAASLPFAGDLIYLLFCITMIFALAFFLPVLVIGFSLMYFSLHEINHADNLKRSISEITFKTQAYGLEKEQ